jgi:hypothetical protein
VTSTGLYIQNESNGANKKSRIAEKAILFCIFFLIYKSLQLSAFVENTKPRSKKNVVS